jgi:uncharacterized protein
MMKPAVLASIAIVLGIVAGPANAAAGVSDPVASVCSTLNLTPYSKPETLSIRTARGTAHFKVEVADSFKEREQGLMCRSGLKDDYGMLFQFPNAADRAFWMKNTISALDIIYISVDGRIVSIQKNAKPLDTTPLPSNGPASGVLEIRAGLSDQLGLKPGDRVEHPFFHKP